MADSIALLALLVGLELILGVDNILVISIFVQKLPLTSREKARFFGLTLALVARILMLYVVFTLANLTRPVVLTFSARDLILLAGGLFLLWKAVREIHHTVELTKEEETLYQTAVKGFAAIIFQIVLLDIVFSVDSVITAVGLTDQLWIIVVAVMISFVGILFFSKTIGAFILHHPTLKILALAFLITIGVTLFMEGMHKQVPKAYIYMPMGFALFVEMLQLRYEHNRQKRRVAQLQNM